MISANNNFFVIFLLILSESGFYPKGDFWAVQYSTGSVKPHHLKSPFRGLGFNPDSDNFLKPQR